MFWRSVIALLPLAMGAQEMSSPPLTRLASGPDGSYVYFQSRLGRKGWSLSCRRMAGCLRFQCWVGRRFSERRQERLADRTVGG